MKTAEIPFNSKPYQNVDPIVLDELSESLYDAYIDESGATVSRPGIDLFLRIGSNYPSTGMYWWERQEDVITQSDGHLYSLTELGGVTDLTNTDFMETNGRIVCADNGDYLIVANGGRMVYTDNTAGSATYIADADAPTEVSHVTFLDNYVIANWVGTGRFYYAIFTGAPTTWNPVDVYSAEFNPDNIIALYAQNNVLIIVGTQSIEMWYNDANSPFQRLGGGVLSRGGMSPYSSLLVNELFYFFDNRRRFCVLNGMQVTTLSTPYDRLIQTFETVDDCFCYYNTCLGRHWIDIFFPTEGRSLRYDIQSDYWCEISTYNSALAQRQMFIGNSYCYARTWNKHILGSYQTDKVYEMAESFTTDDGENIYLERTTGFIDHGIPSAKKRSYRLDMRIKSSEGIGDGYETPYARFRYRDVLKNGTLVWSNWKYIPLNVLGQNGFLFTIRNLGSYWIRQYQIQNANPVKFILGKVTESFDVQQF